MKVLPAIPNELLTKLVEHVVRHGRGKTAFQLAIDVRDALKKGEPVLGGVLYKKPNKGVVLKKLLNALAAASEAVPKTAPPVQSGATSLPKTGVHVSAAQFSDAREQVEGLLHRARNSTAIGEHHNFLLSANELLVNLRNSVADDVQVRACDRLRNEYEALKKGIATFAPEAELLKVNWHILKPSENSWSVITSYYEKLAKAKPLEHDLQRLEYLHGFGPDEIYVGTESFEGYVVMCFTDADLAVLECPYHGNAIYFMKQSEWKVLSQMSKTELLHEYQSQVKRMLHQDGWKKNLKKALKKYGLHH